MSIFENWPHKWFGLWSSDKERVEGFPRFSECVDPDWNPPDKSEIIGYLKDAPTVVTAMVRSQMCMVCGEVAYSPGQYKSDGVWLWPSDLSHMIEKHSVRLPNKMLFHIREAGYRPPPKVHVRVDDLPWPKPPNIKRGQS